MNTPEITPDACSADEFAPIDAALKALEAKTNACSTDEEREQMLDEFSEYGETARDIYEGDPEGTPEVLLACAMGNLWDNTWDMRGVYSQAEILDHIEAIATGVERLA
jgi:hypothetical protein